jgi:transposase
MSENILASIFGVQGGYEVVRTEQEDHFLRLHLAVLPEQLRCPQCGSRAVNRRGGRQRELQTVPIGLVPVFLRTEVPAWACRDCGARFEVAPPFAPAYRRLPHRLVGFAQTLAQMMCLSDVAGLLGWAWDTVKDLVKERLETKYGRPQLRGLRYLSIDEIYVGRQKKFYTLVIDLERGRIVWVATGKKGASLQPCWRALRQAKAKIEAICCDLAAGYWSAVVDNLPRAAVVFDRFHLVKLRNEKLDDLRRALWREAQGLMKQTVKGTRYLLLMRRDHLGKEPFPKLDAALAANAPLWKGYVLKECLGLIWEQTTRRRMEHVLKEWCLLAAGSGVRQLQAMAKTVATHAWGILNWWDHPISNGRMEGINNKVKAMLRQHYGLRDERFFILRLLGLHEAKFKLSGC